jgi:hypothetical protein
MFNILADIPSPPLSWARMFAGDIYELALPCPDKKWVWTNPSVIKALDGDNYLCAVRLTVSPWHGGYASELALVKTSLSGIPSSIKQLRPPKGDRELIDDAPIVHHGAHDCRIFKVAGRLFGTATFWDNTKECVQEAGYTLGRIGLIEIDVSGVKPVWTATKMLPSLYGAVEKNWMPVEDEFSWLYLPAQNIFAEYVAATQKFKFASVGRTHEELEYARGGSQLVKIGANYLLGVVHYVTEPAVTKPTFFQRLRYAHRFMLYDAATKDLLGFSPYFYFISPNGIEFAAGLATTHDGNSVVVSFGYRDTSAWFATATIQSVLSQIHFIVRH